MARIGRLGRGVSLAAVQFGDHKGASSRGAISTLSNHRNRHGQTVATESSMDTNPTTQLLGQRRRKYEWKNTHVDVKFYGLVGVDGRCRANNVDIMTGRASSSGNAGVVP